MLGAGQDAGSADCGEAFFSTILSIASIRLVASRS